MGFLDIFKTKEQNKTEEDIYRTLLIKKLIEDLEKLNKKVEMQQQQIITIEHKITKKKKDDNELTKLEQKIYDTYIKYKINSPEELAKRTNLKIESCRVYCSRIRSKGYKINFN